MNILVINSPLYSNPGDNYNEVLPPIGLGYICTNLKESGFNVELLDAVAGKMPLNEIISYIEQGHFNYVGLNIFSTNHKLVEEIIIRVHSETSFIIGGAFTKSNAQDIVNYNTKNAVNVVIGEADTIVSDIVTGNLQEKPIYQEGNKKIYKVDMHSIYFPKNISILKIDRSFFQYEPTISANNGRKEGNIITSRGCIYNCAFCSAATSLNRGIIVRTKTIKSVRNEILQIIALHPEIKSIRILDDLFLRNSKSMLDATKIFFGLGLFWRAMAHIQSFRTIKDELLFKIKECGCSELSIGIESGNSQILKSINKLSTPDEIIKTIEKIFRAKLSVKGYFVIGFPGETKKQIIDTYNLAKYLKILSSSYGVIFRISVFQFRPYHGTQLFKEISEQGIQINNIKSTGNFGHKTIGEYDFGSGNYSQCSEKILKEFIIKIRNINDEY